MASDMVEILLVEDDPESVELILYALKQRNITNSVRVAADGEEALQAIFGDGATFSRHEQLPRLILLDLKLPKVGGLEVLARVRADPRTRHIPVVVMTASRQESDQIESLRLGVSSYIVKPVDFEKFVQVVSRLGLYWQVLNAPPAVAPTMSRY